MSLPTVYYITQVIPPCYSAGYAMCVCVSFRACVYRSLDIHHLYNYIHIRTRLSPLDLTRYRQSGQMDGEAGWCTTSRKIGLHNKGHVSGYTTAWWFYEYKRSNERKWTDRNGEICSRAIREQICNWKGMMEDNDC